LSENLIAAARVTDSYDDRIVDGEI
jgi:hypothetical protein